MSATRHTPWWRRVWGRVKEPRVISFLVWTGYVVLAVSGVYGLLLPSEALVAAAGPLSVGIGASLVAAGGLLGTIGSLPGWQLTERLGIAMSLGGLLVYVIIIAYLAPVGAGIGIQMGVAYFASVSLIARWIRIKDHVFEVGSWSSRKARRKHPSISVDTGALDVVYGAEGT